MDSGGVAPQLSEEATHHLQQGIVMLLSQWSALQMAVHNEWGGRQSSQLADQLALDIFSWFTHSREPLYIDDLENILDEAMLSLNTMTEDGSIEEKDPCQPKKGLSYCGGHGPFNSKQSHYKLP